MQRCVQPVAVEQVYGFGFFEEFHGRQCGHYFVQCAETAVKRYKHIGVFLHYLFAFMEGGNSDIYAIGRVLAVCPCLWHHSHHFPSGVSRR